VTENQKPLNPIPIDWMIKIGCLAILIYWSLLLVQPFLTIIVWSVILTVVLYPVFNWLTTRLRLRGAIAAASITFLSIAIVLGPATWLGISLVGSLRSMFDQLSSGNLTIPAPPESVKHWPLIGSGFYEFWDLASTNLKQALIELSPQLKPIGSSLLGIAGNASVSSLQFMTAVVISGFLYLPGRSFAVSFKSISQRISTKRGAEFVDLAGATIRNLARGVIGISLLQALLAGVGLIVAGVPAPGLLSFLVLVLGIIQVGASVILVLPIIWAWFTMDTSAALIFTAYMVPVALLDNILRPIVLAHGLKTPMPVILVGVIGGILAHGIIGLFIGPVVLAIAWELLMAWVRGDADITGPTSVGKAQQS
jgi:predicted PurR-regulated permease PerM